MAGGQHGQTHLRNDGRDRASVRSVGNDVHGAPEDLLRHLREKLESAGLELPELLRRGAAAVPADRLLEYAGEQQVRIYEELVHATPRESARAVYTFLHVKPLIASILRKADVQQKSINTVRPHCRSCRATACPVLDEDRKAQAHARSDVNDPEQTFHGGESILGHM